MCCTEQSRCPASQCPGARWPTISVRPAGIQVLWVMFHSASFLGFKYFGCFVGYLPNFAILFLFSKSSFWYGFYLKNENEKFLFYLKYKENMCGSWFASQFTPPIPPPTNQPNAEIWHINVSVPKTKRWIIQIKNFHFCYQKNKTKHNSIFSKCKKVNQLMHFIFTKSTK